MSISVHCTEYRVVEINMKSRLIIVIFHIKCLYSLTLSLSALSPGGVGDHGLELGVDLPITCAVLRCHLTVL